MSTKTLFQTRIIVPLLSACMICRMAAQPAISSNAVPIIPPNEWDRYQKAIEGKNAPILFYGKIVDQDGNALPDVQVKLRVQQVKFDPSYFVLPKYIRFHRTTGPDGSFFLNGVSGHAVDITSITKPGYEFEKDVNPVYGASSGTLEKPVTLVLWDQNHKSAIFKVDKDFEFVPDGRTYALDLDKREIASAATSKGDFPFRLLRPKGVGKWDRFDWSFDFQGEGGNALLETNEGYGEMLFAPNDGYANDYKMSQRASGQPWQGSGNQQFYIKLRGGKEYGKLLVAWDAVAATAGPKTNKAGIRIQYTINPTGSSLVR